MINICRLDSIDLNGSRERPKLAATDVVRNIEVIIPLEGIINVEDESDRLNKDLVNVEKALKTVVSKLSDKSFIKNAPPDIVEKERRKEKDFSEKVSKIRTNLEWLSDTR